MKADIIIKSNNIFDSISDAPFPGFIAVAGNRISFVCKSNVTDSSDKYAACVAAPILCEGDVLGLVLFISDNENLTSGETEYKLAQTIAAFLGKHMES